MKGCKSKAQKMVTSDGKKALSFQWLRSGLTSEKVIFALLKIHKLKPEITMAAPY